MQWIRQSTCQMGNVWKQTQIIEKCLYTKTEVTSHFHSWQWSFFLYSYKNINTKYKYSRIIQLKYVVMFAYKKDKARPLFPDLMRNVPSPRCRCIISRSWASWRSISPWYHNWDVNGLSSKESSSSLSQSCKIIQTIVQTIISIQTTTYIRMCL